MKKIFYLFLFLLFALKGNAQNLILNGDFELGGNGSSAEWKWDVDSVCSLILLVICPAPIFG